MMRCDIRLNGINTNSFIIGFFSLMRLLNTVVIYVCLGEPQILFLCVKTTRNKRCHCHQRRHLSISAAILFLCSHS